MDSRQNLRHEVGTQQKHCVFSSVGDADSHEHQTGRGGTGKAAPGATDCPNHPTATDWCSAWRSTAFQPIIRRPELHDGRQGKSWRFRQTQHEVSRTSAPKRFWQAHRRTWRPENLRHVPVGETAFPVDVRHHSARHNPKVMDRGEATNIWPMGSRMLGLQASQWEPRQGSLWQLRGSSAQQSPVDKTSTVGSPQTVRATIAPPTRPGCRRWLGQFASPPGGRIRERVAEHPPERIGITQTR